MRGRKAAVISEAVRASAAELFADGESVAGVSKRLKVSWGQANKLRAELQGGASVVPEAAVGKRKAPAEEQQDWELKVTVEGEQLDRVWRGLSDEEKATAIQAVLQAQVDAILAIQ